MTTRRKRIPKETPLERVGVSLPVEEVPQPLSVGQQVTITREFKGSGGVIRAGTKSVIEGCQISGEKLQYKILYRGFRFWVPGDIVKSL